MKKDGDIRLVDLVMDRLKDDWPIHSISYFTLKIADNEHYSVAIDHIPIGTVNSTSMRMWVPDEEGKHTVSEYDAADPKFFQHMSGTAKFIMQRHLDAAMDALRNAQYFI